MRIQRLNKIEEFVARKQSVSMEELRAEFDVSMNTVRRDINELVARGTIRKTYGGVTAESLRDLQPFMDRDTTNLMAKQAIGAAAGALVQDGDVIFIDSGTTTKHMFQAIKDRQDLTILTNNLDVIYNAVPYANLRIISLSGTLERDTNAFSGQAAADFLEKFNVNKAFMASTGISIRNGVTNASPQEYPIKQMAIRNASQAILLVDKSKFGVAALMSYCSLEEIDILVCDARPPAHAVEFIEAHGNKIIVAKAE